MPMKCYAAGCNYGTHAYTGPKRSFFRFPEEPDRRGKWILACRRADSIPGKFSVLCDAHFERDCIIDNCKKTLPDGTVVEVPRKRRQGPRLSPEAIPTIFFNDPTGTRKHGGGVPAKRRLPDDEEFPVDTILMQSLILSAKEGAKAGDDAASKPESAVKKPATKKKVKPVPSEIQVPISSLEGLIRLLENLETLPETLRPSTSWLIVVRPPKIEEIGEPSVLFYQLDTDSLPPAILKSMRIDSRLQFEAFCRTNRVTSQAMDVINLEEGRLKLWNEVMEVLKFLDKCEIDVFPFDFNPPEGYRVDSYGDVLATLADRKSALSDDGANAREEFSKLNFLMEQIALLDTNSETRTFTNGLRTWTEQVSKRCPDAVGFLSSSGALTLPLVRHSVSESSAPSKK